MIAGPEGIVSESDEEGIITGERIRWLREKDEELTLPKKYKTEPGFLR